MNQGELINEVSGATGLSKAKASHAVEVMIQTISLTLAAGLDVKLMGFGTFSVAERAARVGRSPNTGEPIKIKASRGVKFKLGKSLKEAVNPKPQPRVGAARGAAERKRA